MCRYHYRMQATMILCFQQTFPRGQTTASTRISAAPSCRTILRLRRRCLRSTIVPRCAGALGVAAGTPFAVLVAPPFLSPVSGSSAARWCWGSPGIRWISSIRPALLSFGGRKNTRTLSLEWKYTPQISKLLDKIPFVPLPWWWFVLFYCLSELLVCARFDWCCLRFR